MTSSSFSINYQWYVEIASFPTVEFSVSNGHHLVFAASRAINSRPESECSRKYAKGRQLEDAQSRDAEKDNDDPSDLLMN
jgi:hypothetical protein